MDWQWLASFVLEAGFGVTAYRLVKQLQANQIALTTKVENHESRLGVLELRKVA